MVGGAGALAGRVVLSNVIASQHDLHAEYRGVVPELASRAHAERVLPVVRASLREAGVTLDDLAAVAVGHRPGLIGSLLVGVSAAKALAWSLGVPVVGVDHVRAHLYAGLMVGGDCAQRTAHGSQGTGRGSQTEENIEPIYPAVGVVVSGGHTSLYRCESPTALTRLGATIDDAMGEAFDKVGAILGLPYPGGPAVDAAARGGNDRAFDFPVSRLGRGSLDFSFSGLKTAVKYAIEGVPGSKAATGGAARVADRTAGLVADVCSSFQRAACRAVVQRVEAVLGGGGDPDGRGDYRAILVGGGVSANSRLRTELQDLARLRGVAIRLPQMSLCVDNAAMIAGLGWRILAERGWAGDDLSLTASASAEA